MSDLRARKNAPSVNTKELSATDLIEDVLREVEEMKARYWREREADVFAEIAIARIRQKALEQR